MKTRESVRFERRTVDALVIEDERSFRHVELYADLKEVLRKDAYSFRILPEGGSSWDRALFLGLTFWGASEGGDVLVDETVPADVVAQLLGIVLRPRRSRRLPASDPRSRRCSSVKRSPALSICIWSVGCWDSPPSRRSSKPRSPPWQRPPRARGSSRGASTKSCKRWQTIPRRHSRAFAGCSLTRPRRSSRAEMQKPRSRCSAASKSTRSRRCSTVTSSPIGCSTREPTEAANRHHKFKRSIVRFARLETPSHGSPANGYAPRWRPRRLRWLEQAEPCGAGARVCYEPPPMPVLTAHAVTKAYGLQPLFESATFTIRRGEKVALLGPNGTGKSTLAARPRRPRAARHGQHRSPARRLDPLSPAGARARPDAHARARSRARASRSGTPRRCATTRSRRASARARSTMR